MYLSVTINLSILLMCRKTYCTGLAHRPLVCNPLTGISKPGETSSCDRKNTEKIELSEHEIKKNSPITATQYFSQV